MRAYACCIENVEAHPKPENLRIVSLIFIWNPHTARRSKISCMRINSYMSERNEATRRIERLADSVIHFRLTGSQHLTSLLAISASCCKAL